MLRVLLGLAAAHSCANETLTCVPISVPEGAADVVQSPDGELHCLANHPYHRCAEGELPCCRGGAPVGHGQGHGGRDRGDRGERRDRGRDSDKDCNRTRGDRDGHHGDHDGHNGDHDGHHGDRDGHHGDHDDHNGDHDDHNGDHDGHHGDRDGHHGDRDGHHGDHDGHHGDRDGHHGDHDGHHGDRDGHHGDHEDHNGTVGLLGAPRGVRGLPVGKPKRGEAVVEVHIAGRNLAAVQALAPDAFAQWRGAALAAVARAAKVGEKTLRLLEVRQGSVVLVLAVPEEQQDQLLAADAKDLAGLCALTPGQGACAVTVRAEPFPLVPVAGGAAAALVALLLVSKALAVGLKRRAAKRNEVTGGLPATEVAKGNERNAGSAETAKVEVGVKASEVDVKALDASVATPSTAAPEDVADLAAVPSEPVEA